MEGQSDLERAMQHAQEMLPDVAAECVIGQLLSVRHQAQDPAVQDFVARVLDMGDWEKETAQEGFAMHNRRWQEIDRLAKINRILGSAEGAGLHIVRVELARPGSDVPVIMEEFGP